MRLPPCLLNSAAELPMELLEIISRPRLSLNGHSVLLNLTAPGILTLLPPRPVRATQLLWSLLNNITYNIVRDTINGGPLTREISLKIISSEMKPFLKNCGKKRENRRAKPTQSIQNPIQRVNTEKILQQHHSREGFDTSTKVQRHANY